MPINLKKGARTHAQTHTHNLPKPKETILRDANLSKIKQMFLDSWELWKFINRNGEGIWYLKPKYTRISYGTIKTIEKAKERRQEERKKNRFSSILTYRGLSTTVVLMKYKKNKKYIAGWSTVVLVIFWIIKRGPTRNQCLRTTERRGQACRWKYYSLYCPSTFLSSDLRDVSDELAEKFHRNNSVTEKHYWTVLTGSYWKLENARYI